MYTLVVAPFFFLYCFLAIYFVLRVFRKTNKLRSRVLAVAFIVLLPTWDVLFSLAIWPVVLNHWPIHVIYREIDVNAMHYEGSGCDYVIFNDITINGIAVHSPVAVCAYDGIRLNNYDFTEGVANSEYKSGKDIYFKSEKYYRCYKCKKSLNCTTSDKEKILCTETNVILSEYSMVRSYYKFLQLKFLASRIYNRNNLEIIAEAKSVSFGDYAKFFNIPFFNWLNWQNILYAPGGYIYKSPGSDINIFVQKALIVK